MAVSEKIKKKRLSVRKILLFTLIFLLVGAAVTLIAIPAVIMNSIVGRRMYRTVYEPADYGVQAQALTLRTDDALDLAAWLVQPDKAKGTVIVLSGIENPSVTAFFGYARMLRDAGYASLLIEMRAHNGSEGDEVALGMLEWLDVKAGVEYLRGLDVLGPLPVIAMGTSMGAATVNVAAGELPEIDGVISISAYSSWQDVFADTMLGMGVPGWFISLEKPFVSLFMGLHYGFDNLKYSPTNGMEKMGGRPVLLMHSTEDSQVPYASYDRLFAAAQEEGVALTTFVREGDEHFVVYGDCFHTPEDDIQFSGAVLDFLRTNFE